MHNWIRSNIRYQRRRALGWVITASSTVGRGTFFDPESFPWIRHLEANWTVIQSELKEVLKERMEVPNFQDISPEQGRLTRDDKWKTFFLHTPGYQPQENRRKCPETVKLIQQIPGLSTAFFSILAARKHIPEHRGPFNGVLRYHLGVIVPKDAAACRIRVGADTAHWEEGKSIVFDDTHPHEVWNDTDSERVVLFVDFLRPMKRLLFPVAVLNRHLLDRLNRSALATNAFENLRAHDRTASAGRTPT